MIGRRKTQKRRGICSSKATDPLRSQISKLSLMLPTLRCEGIYLRGNLSGLTKYQLVTGGGGCVLVAGVGWRVLVTAGGWRLSTCHWRRRMCPCHWRRSGSVISKFINKLQHGQLMWPQWHWNRKYKCILIFLPPMTGTENQHFAIAHIAYYIFFAMSHFKL